MPENAKIDERWWNRLWRAPGEILEQDTGRDSAIISRGRIGRDCQDMYGKDELVPLFLISSVSNFWRAHSDTNIHVYAFMHIVTHVYTCMSEHMWCGTQIWKEL